jgi:hypothetical protein
MRALDLLIAAGLATAVTAGFFLYFNRVKRLPPRQALTRAIGLAYEIWQGSDFLMPAALRDPAVAQKALLEAGLVLKAEVIGRSTQVGVLPTEVARPHPELIGVDALQLARGVAKKILEDRL